MKKYFYIKKGDLKLLPFVFLLFILKSVFFPWSEEEESLLYSVAVHLTVILGLACFLNLQGFMLSKGRKLFHSSNHAQSLFLGVVLCFASMYIAGWQLAREDFSYAMSVGTLLIVSREFIFRYKPRVAPYVYAGKTSEGVWHITVFPRKYHIHLPEINSQRFTDLQELTTKISEEFGKRDIESIMFTARDRGTD